jgi:hypothetical protein
VYSQIRKKSKKSLVGEYFLPLAKVFGEFLYGNYYFITTFTEPEFQLNQSNVVRNY